MAPAPRHRRELQGIAALLGGLFFALSLAPVDVTGPLGRFFARYLWMYLGAGAAFIPISLVTASLGAFSVFDGAKIKRLMVLLAGLILLVPFVIALGGGLSDRHQMPADYDNWGLFHRSIGMIVAPLFLITKRLVGTGGASILGVLSLSFLTVHTFGWHPFRRLIAIVKREEGAGRRERDVRSENLLRDTAPSLPDRTAPPSPLPDPQSPKPKHAPTSPPLSTDDLPAIQAAVDQLPSLDLLDEPYEGDTDAGEEELKHLGDVLIETLATFKVDGKIVGRTTGPVVTQFEVKPAPGVKVGKIASLADDLALAMRAKSIRIVAPIPGKAAVGVEVPNPNPRMVTFRELLEAREWEDTRAGLPIALGRDLEGRATIADLSKMPHLLIAGATGSGKSVCINTIITSLIYRYSPRELRMLMIDPKMVELATYNALPHLRHPVVTNNKEAAQTLKWAVIEMERRYRLFGANTCRNLYDFNKKVELGRKMVEPKGEREGVSGRLAPEATAATSPLPYTDGPLPYIVVIVDELADLMMTVQAEVEKPLALLAQKGRATGIHIILATQRPSVNVITGLIKANFSSRIGFRVASKIDSRTILDQNGAEALLGNGDMLFLPPGSSEPVRLQGAFIGTEETEDVTNWYRERKIERDELLKKKGLPIPEDTEDDIIAVMQAIEAAEAGKEIPGEPGDRDPLFREAAETCLQNQLGSTSLLQRRLRIGYGRAARIIDQLHDAGVLGPPDGSKAREVLIGASQLEEYCG